MSEHRSIEWAIDIIGMCEPIRCVQGGMWFGRNNNFADATFVDYGAADAFAVAAGSLKRLTRENEAMRKALEDISESDWTFDRSRRKIFGIGSTKAAAALASLKEPI